MGKQQTRLYLLSSILLIGGLFGCSDEEKAQILNPETYAFNGVFENQLNGDVLEFKDAQVTFFVAKGLDFTKPFEVEDNYITIEMRNSSKEKRSDIVMRIHGNSELLTCNTCAMYDMSSIWLKKDFVPATER